MSRLDVQRSHLDLQISLLAEREATKTLQLLRAICHKLDLEEAHDPEVLQLIRVTHADRLQQEVNEKLVDSLAPRFSSSAAPCLCAYGPGLAHLVHMTTSALLLGATLVAATAVQAQTPVPDVTVIGCVIRQPDSIPAPRVGHEQEAARGLSLTRVAIPETSTRRGAVSEQQAFWLVGDKAIELSKVVNRQAEVLGRFDERNAANPGDDAGAVPEGRSTAAPRPDPANPSAPTRVLRVVSFRVLDQSCR